MLGSLFFFLFFCAALLLNCIHVSALQIEPLIGMIQVEAGQEGTGSIALTNEKNIPITVEFSLKDFELSGVPIDHEWLALDVDMLHLEPKQQVLLDYKTLIPKGTAGEYGVRIRYHEKPRASGNESVLSIKTAVSVPFYAIVSGTERYYCKLLDFQMNGELANEAVAVFSNLGNAHVRPTGYCRIKKSDGDRVISSARLNSGNSPIYPKEEKKFEIQFDEALPSGKYIAEFQFALFAHADESNKVSFEFEVQ